MAGAMLETVVGEFSKLKEKMEKIKVSNTSKPFLCIKRNTTRAAQVEGCEDEEKQAKEAIFFEGKSKAITFMVEEETLSESTFCLFIDRFVPS